MNHHTVSPGTPQESLYLRTDVTPETLFQAIGRLRQEAHDEIERLLAFLDETDGDADLEPSLSGYSQGMDDREGDCEDEGAQCDDEGAIESDIGDADGLMEQVGCRLHGLRTTHGEVL